MKWKKEDVGFLKENYSKKIPLHEISEKLKKSIKAIHHKAARENLSRGRFIFSERKRQPRKVIEKKYYENNKNKIYNRKKDRINKSREEIKKIMGGKCSKCGYNKCMASLEFHHHAGNKEGQVSRMIQDFSKEKSLKEAKKCILLCANCHRELHNTGSVV